MSQSFRFSALVCALGLACATDASAGSFVFSDTNPQIVTHPPNVLLGGNDPAPSITVCLDPAAQPTAGNPEQSIRNAVATYNRFVATQGNVKPATNFGVPAGQPDFETVFTHELGHCLGMDHTTLGPSEIGCSLGNAGTCQSNPATYGTFSTAGPNGVFNAAAGTDGMRASRDDIRGDDVNLHWYQRGVNDPFALPPAVVDRNTFTVTKNFLPASHTFVETATSHAPCANPATNTASLPGRIDFTQNAMFPVVCLNNVLRDLAPDDINTLRISRAGIDGTQGTSDDYIPTLTYIGKTTNCDVVVKFNGGGLGFCQISASSQGNNFVVSTAAITLGQTNAVNWYFNQTDTTVVDTADLTLSIDATPAPVALDESLAYQVVVENDGPDQATSLQMVQTLPAGVGFESASGTGWTCSHSGVTVTCTRPTLDAGASSTLTVIIDVPRDYAGPGALASNASIASAVDDPTPGNNSDSVTVPVDFIVGRIFGNGFE